MLRNYLKIALRNLKKRKVFSFINIAGLSVGLTACFLIFLYVRFELSYDSFHSKQDRIYRVVADLKTPSETIKTSGPAWAVPPNLKDEFPEVESAVRLNYDNMLVRRGEIKFEEPNSVWADSSLFHVFDFKLVRGDPKTALKDQFSVVFTESAVKKYFGKEDPMGQTVLITSDGLPAKVTGIMNDIPENSQIKAEMIISMTTLSQKLFPGIDSQWANYGIAAYILLKPGADANALTAKFPSFLKRRNGTEMEKLQMFPTLLLEPLKDVYLHSERDGKQSGNINNVYIFSIIAIFILLIACINFINLTTARSIERAREVGIRKVVGALKKQLTMQFMGESLILCLIAFLVTFILSWIFLSGFNQLAGKIIQPGIFSKPSNILLLFASTICIGIFAGIYPSLVLSSFKPIAVLKGSFSTGAKGILLRKVLVVSQFTISIALIIGTIVVYRQMQFMRNQDLGFSRYQELILDTKGDNARNALRQQISTLPNIQSVAMSSSVPGGGNPGAYSQIENTKGDMQIANLDLYFVDFDYIPQFGMKMVAGRPFSKEFGTDTTKAMVLNEAAVKLFGYSSPQQAIGKKFSQWGREGQIIGVIKDFHFRSLQQEIKPLSMRIEPTQTNLVSIKVSSNNIPATIASIENKWKLLLPNRPFSYYFLDEFFDRQYRSEQRFGNLFLSFAILAIFISCLGLLGLASYSTIQRSKEIGIRKTMGATVSNIVHLLSKDFLRLVVISLMIASPIAWYGMYKWLQGFAYRISFSWWVFAAAGILALMIAFFTICFHSVKAALTNPIKSLRTE